MIHVTITPGKTHTFSPADMPNFPLEFSKMIATKGDYSWIVTSDANGGVSVLQAQITPLKEAEPVKEETIAGEHKVKDKVSPAPAKKTGWKKRKSG